MPVSTVSRPSCMGGLFSIVIASVELVSRGGVAPPILDRASDAMAPLLLGGLSLLSRAHTRVDTQG